MILAEKLRARGMTSDGGHRTLPILRCTGSIAVRYNVTLEPAAAQGRFSVSASMPEDGSDSILVHDYSRLTSDDSGFIAG